MIDKAIIQKYDLDNMYKSLLLFANQIKVAIDKKDEISVPNLKIIDSIVICGMGGSAIGGELFKGLLSNQLDIPVFIIKDYSLPSHISAKSFIIISSYSGNTEESLSLFQQTLKITNSFFIISSGGKLIELAMKNQIHHLEIESGLPPRATLGFSFMYLILILYRLKICKYEIIEQIDAYIDNMNQCIKKYSNYELGNSNLAINYSSQLKNKIPIIYSSSNITNVVGYRLKCQIQENAKQFAVYNSFPELNHNEIESWIDPNLFLANKFCFIFIQDASDHERIKKRIKISKNILNDLNHEIISIESNKEHLSHRLLEMIILSDWTSYYLSLLNKNNPTPVNLIEELKKQLNL